MYIIFSAIQSAFKLCNRIQLIQFIFVKVPRQKRNGQLQKNTTFRHKLAKDTKEDTNETDNKYKKKKKKKKLNKTIW